MRPIRLFCLALFVVLPDAAGAVGLPCTDSALEIPSGLGFHSLALDISPRGDFLVGIADRRAAIWVGGGQGVLPPAPPGITSTEATQAYTAGETPAGQLVVAGLYADASPFPGSELLRWVGSPPVLEQTGLRIAHSFDPGPDLGINPGSLTEAPLGMSRDGAVIVGGTTEPYPPLPTVSVGPFAFRLEDGAVTRLDAPPSFPPVQIFEPPFSRGDTSAAHAASDDGRVIVGWVSVLAGIQGEGTRSARYVGPQRAARWTNGEFELLAPPAGDCSNLTASRALAVSGDGSVAAGWAHVCSGATILRRAAVWRGLQLETLPPLPALPGVASVQPVALGVSPDGRVVVGTNWPFGGPAFWWDEHRGVVDLEDMLIDLGFRDQIEQWELAAATGITQDEDGSYVVTGYAWPRGRIAPGNYRPFRVTMPCLDPDFDGLCSEWEEAGYIDLNGNGLFDAVGDLELPGADPLRMDVYVEIDVLDGYAFPEEALGDVERAFARVPNDLIGNPAGARGIGLHLLVDERELPSDPPWGLRADPCSIPREFFAYKDAWFGTPEERQAPAALAAKRALFRYGIFGGRLEDDCGSFSGVAAFAPASDFVVTPYIAAGRDAREDFAAVLMHELGHTLGLHHGGPFLSLEAATNFKPNYHSVMNYTWTRRGDLAAPSSGQKLYAASWRLDFSRESFHESLDESSLDEKAGLGGRAGHAWHFVPVGPLGTDDLPYVERERGPVDYNRNGNATELLTDGWDLNDVVESTLPPECQTPLAEDETLEPHDDWNHVVLSYCAAFRHPSWDVRGCEANGALGPRIVEPTPEILDALLRPFPVDCNGNGVPDDDELAAGTALDSDGDGLLDACEPLEGDCDGDGDVDDDDQAIFVSAFGRSEGEPAYLGCADVDGDQDVTFVDWQLWRSARQQFETATAPACGLGADLTPLVVAGLLLARRRRRRRRG